MGSSAAENAEVILGAMVGQGIKGQVEVDELYSLFLCTVNANVFLNTGSSPPNFFFNK